MTSPAELVVAQESTITAEDRLHWSFQPLERPQIPTVQDVTWPRSAIDAFILARLEQAGLRPMPESDRGTLMRRVSFDLTGLPPDPHAVSVLLNDPSPNAYERLVDRLLDSTAYGERWAQHWLDLARFAETDGFEHDHLRPNAWRYRDWVIDALNADLPGDEFVSWQLAGDELHPDKPAAAIATGFLLCGPDMPDINLQQERRHVFLNDMTSTVSAVFLGLQAGCAQCHDHKYDPISQRDFYSLRAFFENAEVFRDHPIPTAEQRAARSQAEAERAETWQALKIQLSDVKATVLERVRQQQNDPDLALSDDQLARQFKPAETDRHAQLQSALDEVKKRPLPDLPMGRVVREKKSRPAASHLWIRGDFRRAGPRVEPAFLPIANATGDSLAAQTSHGRRRSELARWLTDPRHPLTTRVLVNRLWQWHFGRGLSAAASDFGVMGDEPTHPQLLDWLATELPRQGWSLKRMHRLIVTSATYRQASRLTAPDGEQNWRQSQEHDPYNELWGRMQRRRLEGEAIRDAMLLASGSLNRKPGGPGVRPPLPSELVSTLLKNQWPVTADQDEHRRRSLYLFVRRNLGYPLFEAFDKPDTNISCPRRDQSTIAPQALMLLNSEASLDAARRLAGYAYAHAPDTALERIEVCYLRTLSRRPTSSEREFAIEYLQQSAARTATESQSADELPLPVLCPDNVDRHEAAVLTNFCLALFNLNEFVYID